MEVKGAAVEGLDLAAVLDVMLNVARQTSAFPVDAAGAQDHLVDLMASCHNCLEAAQPNTASRVGPRHCCTDLIVGQALLLQNLVGDWD